MFKFFTEWVIGDLCKDSENPNHDDEIKDILVKYIRLMGRVLVVLIVVAIFFVFVTAYRYFDPKPDFAIDLKLGEEALVGYIEVVLGTVVALAGSLLAISLAQRAVILQKEQGAQVDRQNELMVLEQEREYTILYDHKLGEYQKLMLELSGLLGSCLAVAGDLRKKSSSEAALIAAKSYKKRNNINSALASLHGLIITPGHSDVLLKKYGVEIRYLSIQIDALRLKIMEIASNQTARRFFSGRLLQSAPRFVNSAYFASSEKVISERSSAAILMADLLLKNDGGAEFDQDLCFLLMLLSPVKAQEDSLFLKDLVDSFPSGVDQVIAGFEKEYETTNRGDINPLSNGLEKAVRISNLQRNFVFSDEIVDGLNRIGDVFSRNIDKIEDIFSGKLSSEEIRDFVKRVYSRVINDDINRIRVLTDEIDSSDNSNLMVENLNSILDIRRLHISLFDLVSDDRKEIFEKSLWVASDIFKLVSKFFALDLTAVQGGCEIYAKAFKLILAAFESCDLEQIKDSEPITVIYDFYLRGLAAPNEIYFSNEDRILCIEEWIGLGFLATPAYITAGDGMRLILDRLCWLDKLDSAGVDLTDLLEKIEKALEFAKNMDRHTSGYERDEVHNLIERKIKLIKSKLIKVKKLSDD